MNRMLNFENIVLACIYFDQKKEYVNLGELSDKYFSNKSLFKKVFQYRDSNKPYDIAVASNYFSPDELEIFEKSIDEIKSISNYNFYYTELRKKFYEDDIQKQIQDKLISTETVQNYIDLIKSSTSKEKVYNFEEDLHDYLYRFEERVVGKFERYNLGMKGFDETFGYVRPKRFYTIGASSGVGKTNVMLKLMLKQMEKDVPCLFFTAEMDYDALVERMGAINSKLRLFDILNARLSKIQSVDYVKSLQDNVYGKKSYIYETPKFNVSKVKSLIDKTNAKFIFVDYLQKFNMELGRNQTSASVMNGIANGLKEITMERNVVIFAGSQLGAHADRNNPKPSDLKESGGILEASDGLILIGEINEDDNYKKLKIDIAKNKYGICDKFVYVMDRKTCDMEYSSVDTINLKEEEHSKHSNVKQWNNNK